MAKYHSRCIAELTHQLTLSPARLRLKQLEAIEYLIDLLEAGKRYPYEFICHHITGYRPKKASAGKTMAGKSLIEDLVLMVEELTTAQVLPCHCFRLPVWTTEELADRLSVSTKTICRWRRRGLPGRKLRYPDNTVRMSFLESSIRRFVIKNQELVKRGAAFKQLSRQEKQQIVSLAREILGERRVRLHELSQLIATRMGRAVETVRYTLRRWDQAHPEEALFGRDDQPVLDPQMQAIYDAWQQGQTPGQIGRRFGKNAETVRNLIREVRARLLSACEISYIYNAEFDSPAAETVILDEAPAPEESQRRTIRPPRDLPPYLQDLYRQPLFTPEQERHNFRLYNFIKHKAERLRKELDILSATDEQLDRIESLLTEAEKIKNEILRANLRLVVSIARRHVGQSPCFFEVVSDGNLSLMRAVEKFDYARGFKFSTYASWAIMRNYARTIPERMYPAARLVTGNEEILAAVPARTEHPAEAIAETAQSILGKGLELLTARERDVIEHHYGLKKGKSPLTLEQIGKIFGVTKERVRQIERKALIKLRTALGQNEPEPVVERA